MPYFSKDKLEPFEKEITGSERWKQLKKMFGIKVNDEDEKKKKLKEYIKKQEPK